MSDDQSPEAPEPGATAPDPEAPWGRKPDGTPYKRDPAAFAHLRGQPFGSLNGKGPQKRTSKSTGKPRASAAGAESLAMDAAGYRGRIRRFFLTGAKMLSRRAPVDAALVAVRADSMAEAWGRVAVSYPKFGRFLDRAGKGGDLSDAIGGTLMTAAMIAHVHGLTHGTPFGMMIEELVDQALAEFADSPEFAGMRAAQDRAMAAALLNGNPGGSDG